MHGLGFIALTYFEKVRQLMWQVNLLESDNVVNEC